MRIFRSFRPRFLGSFPLLLLALVFAVGARAAERYDNFFDPKSGGAALSAGGTVAGEAELARDFRRARFQDVGMKGLALLAQKPAAPVNGLVAVALAGGDDFTRATNYLQKAVASGEADSAFHSNLVVALAERRAGRFEVATNACLQAIKANPRHPIPLVALALVHFSQSEHEAVLLRCREALALEPNLPFAEILSGLTYRTQGKFSEAIAAFARAGKLDPKEFRAPVGIAETQLRLGRLPETIKTCQDFLAQNPDQALVREVLARALMRSDRIAEAVTEAENAVSSDPNSALALQTLSAAHARQADFLNTVNTLRKLVVLKPDSLEAHYMAGLFLAAQNQRKEARKTLEIASTLAGGKPEIALVQGIVEHLDGKFDAASAFFEAAVASTNQMTRIRGAFCLANLCLSQKRWVKARDAFGQARAMIANAEFETQDYKVLCKEDHPTANAMTSLATLLHTEGMPEAAIKVFRESFAKGPGNLPAMFVFSRILFQKKSYDESLAILNKLTKSAPRYAPAYLGMAEVQTVRKEYQNAVSTCKKAMELQPENPSVHYRLAALYATLKQPLLAEGEYRSLVKLLPESPVGYNDLACNLAERDDALDEALGQARKAVELSDGKPTASTCLDTLGWVLYKKKDYPKALETLQSALKLNPTGTLLSFVQQHLGQVYEATGANDKALLAYRIALQNAPEGNRAEEVQALLSQLQKRL